MGESVTYTKDIYNQKEEYMNYIRDHKMRVNACYRENLDIFYSIFPDVYKNPDIVIKLLINLDNHDNSKTSLEEFKPYADKFFPIKGENINNMDQEFNRAWLHHIHHNPHHPEHWILYDRMHTDILDMTDIFIIEMICNWLAICDEKEINIINWWDSNYIPLSYNTRKKVSDVMCKLL